jgi:hypothetical protein
MVNDDPSLIISDYHDFQGKSSFISIRLFSAAAWRMTPSLSRRGKQLKGSIPLTPSFFRIFQPYRELSQLGGSPSGVDGSMKSWSPQELLVVSMRISTESKIAICW